MKPGPCTPCEGVKCPPIPKCADGSQPVIIDCCSRCTGAVINDCLDITCTPDYNCRSQQEIWLPNECCPRCKDPFSDCSDVFCYQPKRICRFGEERLPKGACCPICVHLFLYYTETERM